SRGAGAPRSGGSVKLRPALAWQLFTRWKMRRIPTLVVGRGRTKFVGLFVALSAREVRHRLLLRVVVTDEYALSFGAFSGIEGRFHLGPFLDPGFGSSHA